MSISESEEIFSGDACANALLALEPELLVEFGCWQDELQFEQQEKRTASSERLRFHADFLLVLELLRASVQFDQQDCLQSYLNWLGSRLAACQLDPEALTRVLGWLKRSLEQRLRPEHVQRVFPLLDVSSDTTDIDVWAESETFEQAILSGDQASAIALVKSVMQEGHGLVAIEAGIVRPALYRLGERWRAGEISVAQEHLATAICQLVMTMGLLGSPVRQPVRRRVLFACVEGNQHALGLRAMADEFHLKGWDVHYLGANVPTSDLLHQVAQWRPHLLGLSVSLPQQLSHVHAIIAALRNHDGLDRPAVMFGGFGILAPVRYRQRAGPRR